MDTNRGATSPGDTRMHLDDDPPLVGSGYLPGVSMSGSKQEESMDRTIRASLLQDSQPLPRTADPRTFTSNPIGSQPRRPHPHTGNDPQLSQTLRSSPLRPSRIWRPDTVLTHDASDTQYPNIPIANVTARMRNTRTRGVVHASDFSLPRQILPVTVNRARHDTFDAEVDDGEDPELVSAHLPPFSMSLSSPNSSLNTSATMARAQTRSRTSLRTSNSAAVSGRGTSERVTRVGNRRLAPVDVQPARQAASTRDHSATHAAGTTSHPSDDTQLAIAAAQGPRKRRKAESTSDPVIMSVASGPSQTQVTAQVGPGRAITNALGVHLHGGAPALVPRQVEPRMADLHLAESIVAHYLPPPRRDGGQNFTKNALPIYQKLVPPTTPRLPPFLPIGHPSTIFTSEILPRSLSVSDRETLTILFRTFARYVPACISMAQETPIQYHVSLRVPVNANSLPEPPLGSGRRGWPTDRIPLEVFSNIAKFLPRDTLQQMRQVNHEFESKISNNVFSTVVVPFRAEIYGMLGYDNGMVSVEVPNIKGKGKAKDGLMEKKIPHDGMKVFRAWGPHINKFAMAFEADEEMMNHPPIKGRFESHETFWGIYEWPHPRYNRFKICETLEKKADEFSCMSAALSNLSQVREVALSIDSGLGWLCGPDISDRAKIFEEKPKIFGSSTTKPNAKAIENQQTWSSILESFVSEAEKYEEEKNGGMPNDHGFYEVEILDDQWFGRGPIRHAKWFPIDAFNRNYPLVFQGVNLLKGDGTFNSLTGTPQDQYYMFPINIRHLTSMNKNPLTNPFASATLKPNSLTPAQREWLLETEWAQRAFLSSFCMALSDNFITFCNVRSLTIAKISSRFLTTVRRDDIWNALPQLETLTINVSPDWRNIIKGPTGEVVAPQIHPSTAATQFYELLASHISKARSIKKLHIGYVGGGEHQTGIFGRNDSVLPAPLSNFSSPRLVLGEFSVLVLPYVEHMTFSNCWFTPPMLKTFVAQMGIAEMRSLKLDSVSLTANPEYPPTMEANTTEDGIYNRPQGLPRYTDAKVGNFFQQFNPAGMESGAGWLTNPKRVGSWANVLDAITPGPTFDLIRYAFQYRDTPPVPKCSPLERIELASCGHVCLLNHREFTQLALPSVSCDIPAPLRKRAMDLMYVMMHCQDDQLLGRIITGIQVAEEEAISKGFQMAFGWEDETKAMENSEDGQPKGGSGRFTGTLEQLTYSEDQLDRLRLP